MRRPAAPRRSRSRSRSTRSSSRARPRARSPKRWPLGLKKTPVELAVAYDGTCVTDAASHAAIAARAPDSVAPEMPRPDILIARPGIGFPAPVHLERFGSPARLAVTDDPRLASVGGAGMLALVVSAGQLGQALAFGTVSPAPAAQRADPPLRSHAPLRLRARRRARAPSPRTLGEVVQRIEAQHHAPVVLEFAGPSARLLSVAERAVLCGIAPAARRRGGALRERREDRGVPPRSAPLEGAPRARPRSGRAVRRGHLRRSRRGRPAARATRPARCARCAIWPASR